MTEGERVSGVQLKTELDWTQERLVREVRDLEEKGPVKGGAGP